MRITVPLIVLALSACTQDLPNSRDTISQAALDAPFPELVPVESLLAQAQAGSTIELDTARFETRVASLKRRAAALQGRSVIDGATRLRLINAGNRNAARIQG